MNHNNPIPFMKKIITGLLIGMIALPLFASAHAHYNYDIKGSVYEFTVGSLGEPIAVDDRTGVDLRVKKLGAVKADDHHDAEAGDHNEEGVPVTGLESTLKVEIAAGGEKKVFDLVPTYGVPGSYYAKFYPTVETTYVYRFFGTVDGTPFEFSAECTPAGHARGEEDKTRVEVSDGVARVLKSGGFGCPVSKTDLSFPEQVVSNADLLAIVSAQETMLNRVAREFRITQIALGFMAITLAVIGLRRKKALV